MIEEAEMPPGASSVDDFAFQDFYRASLERERMQVSREEMTWSERSEPDGPVDVLLNFGCNVRHTPHLQREAVAVLEVLGVNFAAVAGQQFCCGKPYSGDGLPDFARTVVAGSVRRMAAYQPKRAIQWCSACEMQFHDLVQPQIGISFASDGVAEFLLERIKEVGDDVPWRTDVNITAVVHGHLGEHPVRDGHPPVAMQLLQQVPGVRVLGYAETSALDVCDNAGPAIASIGTREYQAAQGALEGYLAEQGADTLVTLYHGCTREMGKFTSDRFAVRHYISVLAEALGVAKPDRFSAYWRLADARKVMEASRPNWESWGITADEALRLAHKYFIPSYAANLPDCPCAGQCSRTGANWLGTRRLDHRLRQDAGPSQGSGQDHLSP